MGICFSFFFLLSDGNCLGPTVEDVELHRNCFRLTVEDVKLHNMLFGLMLIYLEYHWDILEFIGSGLHC